MQETVTSRKSDGYVDGTSRGNEIFLDARKGKEGYVRSLMWMSHHLKYMSIVT